VVGGAEGSSFEFLDDFFCDLASFSFSRSISRSRSSYDARETSVIDSDPQGGCKIPRGISDKESEQLSE